MDSDDEQMIELLMQKEANAAAERQEQMLMLTATILCRKWLNSRPRHGGSKKRMAANKERHREAGALLLDTDYFAENATQTAKDFRRRFRMNKDLFMKIVFGFRKYDNYFMCKKDCTDKWGFLSV